LWKLSIFFLFDLKKDVMSFFSLILLELFVNWVFSSYKTRSRYIYFLFGESLIFFVLVRRNICNNSKVVPPVMNFVAESSIYY
jgi:hypothetical protein